MTNPLDKLKSKLFKNESQETGLTNVLELIRELGCLSDIVGRDFDIMNPKGKVVYTIRQKPISIKQINILLEELYVLKKMDNEREAAKWGKKR